MVSCSPKNHTVYRADGERAIGKLASDNVLRKGIPKERQRTNRQHTARSLADMFLKDKVETLAEDQPNEILEMESSDDEMDHLQLHAQRGTDPKDRPRFELQEKVVKEKRGLAFADVSVITSALKKKRTKRHMDPLLLTDLFGEYKLDMEVQAWAPDVIVSYATFTRYYHDVLNELKIYVRKNKGVSGDCDKCRTNDANLARTDVTPAMRQRFKQAHRLHLQSVRFIREKKLWKSVRGVRCAQNTDVLFIGIGMEYGATAVWGSGENDGAAQWYTMIPSDGRNKGKARVPGEPIEWKAIVRVIHGETIMVALAPPWLLRSGNPDFNATVVLETFLGLEKLWGRLPKRWYEHFDAGDGNWTNTTLLFYCYLVEKGIFDEVIIARHFKGHTHELVDGENSRIRAFMIGLLKGLPGACIGTTEQLLKVLGGSGRLLREVDRAPSLTYCCDISQALQRYSTGTDCGASGRRPPNTVGSSKITSRTRSVRRSFYMGSRSATRNLRRTRPTNFAYLGLTSTASQLRCSSGAQNVTCSRWQTANWRGISGVAPTCGRKGHLHFWMMQISQSHRL